MVPFKIGESSNCQRMHRRLEHQLQLTVLQHDHDFFVVISASLVRLVPAMYNEWPKDAVTVRRLGVVVRPEGAVLVESLEFVRVRAAGRNDALQGQAAVKVCPYIGQSHELNSRNLLHPHHQPKATSSSVSETWCVHRLTPTVLPLTVSTISIP